MPILDVRASPQQRTTLPLGHAAPDSPLDAVIERLREAFRPDRAISTHSSGTLLVFAFRKQCIG